MFRNKYSAMILILLFSAGTASATSKTDRERGDIKGPVRSIRTESALYSGPAGSCTENPKTLESFSKYNAEGNLTELTDHNFDGTIHRHDVFSYDASGVRSGLTSSDDSGLAFLKRTFDSDNGGRPLSETMFKRGGSIDSIRTWQYNNEGDPITTSNRDSAGVVTWSQTLDPTGKPTEEDEYKNGVLVSKWVTSYDGNGNLLERTHYKADGSLVDGPKSPAKSVYASDSAGHVIEQMQYDANGALVWKLKYAYDAQGNISEESAYREGAKLISHRTYTYQYDSFNNWTKQTISEDFSNTCSQPMQVLYRTITYY